jgi:hypothetical protein
MNNYTIAQSHYVAPQIENLALDNVMRQQMEMRFSQAIDQKIEKKSVRAIVKLSVLENWPEEFIAQLLGDSVESVRQSLKQVEPQVRVCLIEARKSPKRVPGNTHRQRSNVGHSLATAQMVIA